MRTAVAAIDAEILRLTKEGTSSGDKDALAALAKPWADLVAQLALGPEPEVRECPHCSAIGVREATTCGFCWKKLAPPPPKVVDA